MWKEDNEGNFHYPVGAFFITVLRPNTGDGVIVPITEEGCWMWAIRFGSNSLVLRGAKTWRGCVIDARAYLMETLLTAISDSAKMCGIGDQVMRIEGGDSADKR